jgi:hypothetical protein
MRDTSSNAMSVRKAVIGLIEDGTSDVVDSYGHDEQLWKAEGDILRNIL